MPISFIEFVLGALTAFVVMYVIVPRVYKSREEHDTDAELHAIIEHVCEEADGEFERGRIAGMKDERNIILSYGMTRAYAGNENVRKLLNDIRAGRHIGAFKQPDDT